MKNLLKSFCSDVLSHFKEYLKYVSKKQILKKIYHSELFDNTYYQKQLSENSKMSRTAAVRHYYEIGWRNKLNPSSDFSTEGYFKKNPDVRIANINPLGHYLVHGYTEEREIDCVENTQQVLLHRFIFNVGYYADKNKIAGSPTKITNHWLRYGIKRGLPSSPVFHLDFLQKRTITSPQPIAEKRRSVITSYIKNGIRTGAQANRGFDPKHYRIFYPDIQKMYGDDYLEIIQHFLEIGYYKRNYRLSESRLDKTFEISTFSKSLSAIPRVLRALPAYLAFIYENQRTEYVHYPKKLEKHKVSIIILNHNGEKFLKRLLPALYKRTLHKNFEVIIGDNASTDQSFEVVRKMGKVNIKLIQNPVNKSFSEGNNALVKLASGDFLVFLNNDVVPLKGWLTHLLIFYTTNSQDSSKIGALGSKLFYPAHHPSKPFAVQHMGISLDCEGAFFRPRNKTHRDAGNTVGVTGACLFVEKDLFQEVGGFDEKYNYGYEDVDFCLKLIQKGTTNYVVNHSMLIHHGFGTQGKEKNATLTKRRISNIRVFNAKWYSSLNQAYWSELLAYGFDERLLKMGKRLKVGFIVSSRDTPKTQAGDVFTALELAQALTREFGFECELIEKKRIRTKEFNHDVIVNMIHNVDITEIRITKPKCWIFAWTRNWFEGWVNDFSLSKYDGILTSSKKSIPHLKKMFDGEILYFPIATNSGVFNSKITADLNISEKYKSDICFTGNYWGTEREISHDLTIALPELKQYSIKIFGKGWRRHKGVKRLAKGAVPYKDLPLVYAGTKIVIDDANLTTKEWGSVNSRVFDALASGKLVITNSRTASEELFGGKLPVYSDWKDLAAKITFYLTHEDTLEVLVKELKEIVDNHHTYKYRAAEFRSLLTKLTQKSKICLKVPAPNWQDIKHWGDFYLARGLRKAFQKKGYHCIIQPILEWDYPAGDDCEIVILLRGLTQYTPKPHQLNLMWQISHPDNVTLNDYEQFDHVFIASSYWTEHMKKRVGVPVSCLMQCTDPDLFFPTEKSEKYAHQILFIGNSRNERRKIVADCIELDINVSVFGRDWENLIPEKYIKGTFIPHDELRFYYSNAGIVLNDHWDDMKEKGFISNRIFDAGACGARIISDYVVGLEELTGEGLWVYGNKLDLLRIIHFHKNRTQKTSSIRQREFIIRSKNTFKQRVEEIIGVINSIV